MAGQKCKGVFETIWLLLLIVPMRKSKPQEDIEAICALHILIQPLSSGLSAST